MCSNRPLVYSAAALDWEPPAKKSIPRLPLRERIFNWILSRAEFVHRGIRDFYRTPLGFLLVWLNVGLLAFVVASRIGGES